MKKKILVTGGTVFVSKCVAEYFAKKGHEVYVLNRNHRKQPEGTILINADRHHLGEILKPYDFDVIMDVTSYNKKDIKSLLEGLGNFREYIFISSSAVYPETLPQPFGEEATLGANRFWGQYGTDKIEAEQDLLANVPGAYIIRPPYLYGAGNNVYREAFVFDCAMKKRKFYLPKEGEMKLQFFHVQDLCGFMETILEKKPKEHIFNVGNEEMISILDWVKLCYEVVGEPLKTVPVYEEVPQRNYFSFYDYEYCLDVSRQKQLMGKTIPMREGLKEAYAWYLENKEEVNCKPFIEYIDTTWQQNVF